MRDGRGPGHDRSFSIAPPGRAADDYGEHRASRTPDDVVGDKFAEASRTLASIADSELAELAATLPVPGDRRSPRECRRDYDAARDAVARSLRSADGATQFAVAHGKRHGIDTSARLAAYHGQREAVCDQLARAPGPPPRFARVVSEDAILAAIRLPPGAERNTELLVLFSELDPASARTLHGRLALGADPEDELAAAFRRIVDARDSLLGVLAGTQRLRVDAKTFRRTERAAARPAPAGAPPSGPRPAPVEATPPGPMSAPVEATPSGPMSAPAEATRFGPRPAPEAATPSGPMPAAAAVTPSGPRPAPAAAPPSRAGAGPRSPETPPVQRKATGGASDPHERHADAVVAGRSAEALLDDLPRGSATAGRAVQRSPRSGAEARVEPAVRGASVPPRGSYLVEYASGGSYVFVFNTFDRNRWSEPVLTGLRYYMHQVFPGADDAVIRTVFTELGVRFQGASAAAFPADHRYELTVDPRFHERVLAWMAAHRPAHAPHAPTAGPGALRTVDAGATTARRGEPPGSAAATPGAQPQRTTLAGDAAQAPVPGDARATHEAGKGGARAGEPDGDSRGWQRWIPQGQLRLQPNQPTYVAGAAIDVELAWDLSVHPAAGQILLPQHCTYAWTVHRGGKLVDSVGRSILADDRRARLRLGSEPGTYEITVTATSPHFRTTRHRFSSHVVVTAVSEQAFDRAAFDAQLAAPDAAFARDAHGALQLRPGQTARTLHDELGALDVSRGGIAALADKGQITGSDRDVATAELDRQRAALVSVEDRVAGGTPYIVRGTFVSREDSSTTPLRLLLHGFRRHGLGGAARYEVVLHDTTFGDAVQHPGSADGRVDREPPGAVYAALETRALAQMARHFHAHNDYPRGTVHLAAQRPAGGTVWETTLDTDNGRKTAKKILGTAALIGGAALMIVPGGSVVSAGLLVMTSSAGIASVALEVEDRIAKEGRLALDRRLAMDVLQVAAIALPFGTLAKTFAGASQVAQGRFLLCMAGLDVAQGFVIAADVQHQLLVIEASTAVQLASATGDDQRKAIHAERDRRVAEILGGAVVNGGFLLVSFGGGLRHAVAVTRAGVTFTVREPVLELVTQGRAPLERALSTGGFEHEGRLVELTAAERRYLAHEVAELARRDERAAPVEHGASAAVGGRAHEVASAQPAGEHDVASATWPAGAHDTASATRRAGAHDTASAMQPAGAHDTASAMRHAGAHDAASARQPVGAFEAAQTRQASDKELARIRTGTPGKIRSAAELSSADVAHAMNAQLLPIQASEVHAIIDSFSPAEQAQARIVLARASGFGRMEGLNPLREAIEPHLAQRGALFTPGKGSLADNLAYGASKGLFPGHPGGFATTERILPRTVVILDEVVLARIQTDPAFAQSLHKQRAVLIEPRGFTDGINLFNAGSPEQIRQRTQRVLDRAKAIAASSDQPMSFDDAVTAALDQTTHDTLAAAGLTGQLEVVDPAMHAATSGAIHGATNEASNGATSEAIAAQLNGEAGITTAQLDLVLAKVGDADRALLRELLAQQAEVFSPRRISNDMLAMHQHHMELAAQHHVKPEDIYYFVYVPNKSYGMMTMAHRQATGTPVERYINGEAELKSRNLRPNTMLIILDDVAGTGISLRDASSAAGNTGYPGHIVASPMISTLQAERLFNGPDGLASRRSNTAYAPQKLMGALEESPLYRGLPPDRQQRLKDVLLSLQFAQNGTSVAFPYMAPDNNNTWFADQLAQEFILNKSRAASKSSGEWYPPKPDRGSP